MVDKSCSERNSEFTRTITAMARIDKYPSGTTEHVIIGFTHVWHIGTDQINMSALFEEFSLNQRTGRHGDTRYHFRLRDCVIEILHGNDVDAGNVNSAGKFFRPVEVAVPDKDLIDRRSAGAMSLHHMGR